MPPPSPCMAPTSTRERPRLPFGLPHYALPAHIPVKSFRGVFDTPLNGVWDAVGPQIRDLIKARKIDWSSIDPARFFTYAPLGDESKKRGVSVPSSYGLASLLVLPPPIPPTRSPKRSLPFCERTESTVLLWNGAKRSRRGLQVPPYAPC